MLQAQNVFNNEAAAKPIWLVKGTCGGCAHYLIADNQKDLANVPCSNEKSVLYGAETGVLGVPDMNGCTSYEPKDKAPEGFVLV